MNNYPNYYRSGLRYDRVDQEEVPESKHTVFIRGLPGHIKTDEIKDFFEDHVGPCSFDFIKLSQDQMKIFVAVRFETRDAAKECMHKYKEGEILGYPVEITWFRDIRRYVSYHQSQGTRPPTMSRRNYGGRNRGNYERSGRKEYSSSRSRSRSPRRSSREGSRGMDIRAGRNSDARSRSHSRGTSISRERSKTPQDVKAEVIKRGSTPPLPPSPAPDNTSNGNAETGDNKKIVPMQLASRSQSPVVERKTKKSKKEKKKRRRRSPSTSSGTTVNEEHSADDLSESELRKKILRKREKALKMEADDVVKQLVKPTLGKWVEEEESTKPESSILQNTTLKFGLESMEDIPKRLVRETPLQSHTKKGFLPSDISASYNKADAMNEDIFPTAVPFRSTKPDFAEDSQMFTKKGKHAETSKSDNSAANPIFNISDNFYGKRGGFKVLEDQKSAKSISSKRAIVEEPDDLVPASAVGNLRLSSLTRQLTVESDRERKLDSLTPQLLNKYVAKKKEFEAAFKADRETFGFVTKTLMSKDPELEGRMRLALLEAIKDMEEAFTYKMDQYLDQLIMFMSI